MASAGRLRLPTAAPPPSPDDLEAGARKYKRKRRRSAADIRKAACLGLSAAAWTAAGVLLGLFLAAATRHLAASPAAAPPLESQAAQAMRRGMLQQQGCPSNCSVSLAAADQQLLRREVEGMAASLCDPRPWLKGGADAAADESRADVVAKGQGLAVQGSTVPRVVDEAYGRQTTANVPGVEDMHAELRAFNDAMLASITFDDAAAAARQRPSTAAELGLAPPLDSLNETASLPMRVSFLNELHEEVQAGEEAAHPRTRVCLAATVSADLAALRRDILPWLQCHTEIGAAHFYLLYDGSDAEAVRLLGGLRHVTLLHIHPPFAAPTDLERFRLYAAGAADAATRKWVGQPGNFGLMIKQGYGLGEALRLAAADGMTWLLHLDPDELFYPGGPALSLPAVLARQPAHVPAVRFMNFEGQPEAGDLTNRIEQVTLFRVHKHFITPEAHFYRQKYRLGDTAAFLMLYANGKSAVRVDAPGVHQLGPHFFSGSPSPRWQTPANPSGAWQDVVSDESVVLHYAYSYERDVAAKAHRSCPDAYLEAARRGDRDKVKECFVIDFDADAYMAAAQGPAAARDFFYSRMVLSEGSRVRCSDSRTPLQQGWCTLTGIERFKYLMTKLGLYRRIHAPQAVLRQHERRIQRSMREGDRQQLAPLQAEPTEAAEPALTAEQQQRR